MKEKIKKQRVKSACPPKTNTHPRFDRAYRECTKGGVMVQLEPMFRLARELEDEVRALRAALQEQEAPADWLRKVMEGQRPEVLGEKLGRNRVFMRGVMRGIRECIGESAMSHAKLLMELGAEGDKGDRKEYQTRAYFCEDLKKILDRAGVPGDEECDEEP